MHQGKWNGLGGKLKEGETPEECVCREVEEESGYKIKTPVYKGLIVFPAFDEIEDWYVFVFTAEQFSGEPIESAEGELCWIDDKKLFELLLWDGDYVFMKWLDKPGIFSAKLIYEKKRLVDYQVKFY